MNDKPTITQTYHLSRVNGHAVCTVIGGDKGEILEPGPSQKLWNHSPDGFNFGYAGSGPAQLALAILLHNCRRNKIGDADPAAVALDAHQAFKFRFIATAEEGDCITDQEISDFLIEHQAKRATADHP